jgi:hypothetical protein
MASRAGEEFFGNRHRAITCQADLEVLREGRPHSSFAIGTAVRASSHLPASTCEPNNSTIVSISQVPVSFQIVRAVWYHMGVCVLTSIYFAGLQR